VQQLGVNAINQHNQQLFDLLVGAQLIDAGIARPSGVRRFDHIDEMLDVARNGSNDLKLAKKRIAVARRGRIPGGGQRFVHPRPR
jgi:hypothetical protein